MEIFSATLGQTAVLFVFIVLGYMLMRCRLLPDNAQTVLSKLENLVCIPALVLGTFISNFTVEKVTMARDLLLFSLILQGVSILLSVPMAKLCSRDAYERRIYRYGLCFANFGFMGNAVVSALFPDIFMEYLIFTLPMWSLIYLWGAPVLLMADGGRVSARQRLKSFVNPMFVCTILGMIIGLTGLKMPAFLTAAVTSAGNCMTPLAMLLTGMTVAQFDLKKVLSITGVYRATALRLLVFPALILAFLLVCPLPRTFAVCAVCALSMPLGLNTIIIPAAYGKDTRVAAGMALVSHIISCVTIPAVFMLFEMMQ